LAVGALVVGGLAVGEVAVGGEPVGKVAVGDVMLEPGAVGVSFVLEPFCVGARCWRSELSVLLPWVTSVL
jgi:hypothetical protein